MTMTMTGCNDSMTDESTELVSLHVTPAVEKVAKGLTLQYRADGIYSDNSVENITTEVSWSSSDTSIATIDSAGLATTVSDGNTIIVATSKSTFGTLTYEAQLEVSGTLTTITIKVRQIRPRTPGFKILLIIFSDIK